MSSAGNHRNGGIAKVPRSAVLFGVGGPAVSAVDQRHGTPHAIPKCLKLVRSEVNRRPALHVIIKFPAVGSVFIPNEAGLGQVPRLIMRETGVSRLHALKRGFWGGVTFTSAGCRQPALL